MPTEKFDIFDENNNPLWITKSRKIVHSELKDWHRVNHIWIYNDAWEILCQKRSAKKDSNPWLWMSFFGWHLKAWETYEENAINELEEEIWLKVLQKDLIFIHNRKSEQSKHFWNIYVLKYNWNIEDLSFLDNEVEKVEFLSIYDLTKKIEKWYFCNVIDVKVMDYIRGNI